MPNLSNTELRTMLASKPTRRRGGTLPRQNTQAPVRRGANEIRSGVIGDAGGVDALLELTRRVTAAGSALAQRSEIFDNKRKTEEDAQGKMDGQTGHVDPVLFKRSTAYSNAVMTQRAQTDFMKSKVQLDKDINALINSDEDPDPAVREARIRDLIEHHVTSLVMPDGETVAYTGYPPAQRWLAGAIGQIKANVLDDAVKRTTARMNDESLAQAATAYDKSFEAGIPFSLRDNFANLLPTVDRKEAKKVFLTVAKDHAMKLRDAYDDMVQDDPEGAQALANKALGITTAILRQDGEAQRAVTAVDLPPSTAALSAPSEAPEAQPDVSPVAAPQPLLKPFAAFGATRVAGKIGDSRAGGKRRHNGEDFPMPVGTELIAPMDGTVTYKWTKAGGHQAFLTMDNGDVLGIAHLKEKPSVGRVMGGAAFALSGNTGESRGPHAHMTVTVKGKKVSPSEYFKTATTGDAGTTPDRVPPPTGPAIDPSLLDPDSPSEIAAKLPLPATASAPDGVYTLTADERLELRSFQRGLAASFDEAKLKATTKRQTDTAHLFLSRMNGLGAPVTVSELQEAAREGRITVPMMDTLLNQKEQETRAERAEANAARAEMRAERAEQREADRVRRERSVDDYTASILAPIASGQLTTTQAKQKLLDLMRTIPDRETRNAVVSEVGRSVDMVADLRKSSREHARAVQDFSDWARVYKADLRNAVLPRGMSKEQAGQMIDDMLNGWVLQLSQGNVPPGDIPAFMKRAEEWMDNKVSATFPTRRATK